MSFSDIGGIIREYNEQEEKESLKEDTMIISEETKAIDLFSQGKSPIDVKVILNISTNEVEAYYQDYWKLVGLHDLYKYYKTEIKNDLPYFLKLYTKVRELRLRNDQVAQALNYLHQIPHLKLTITQKINEIKELDIEIKYRISGLEELEANINKFKNSFEKI